MRVEYRVYENQFAFFETDSGYAAALDGALTFNEAHQDVNEYCH